MSQSEPIKKNPSKVYNEDADLKKQAFDVDEKKQLENVENGATDEKNQRGYPKVVFLIILNEFCERFSYYGLRTVLYLYLNEFLGIEANSATAIYHAFTMLCYFSPIAGAILADGFIGLYNTIFYVSCFYFCGELILALTAMGPLGAPNIAGPMIALIMIALGTGGIKPCVSAFGGNQFHPSQKRYLETFFSVFYLSINVGSMISTIVTPIFRSDISCFGAQCYPLAFGVPAGVFLIGIVVFLIGTPHYNRTNDKKQGKNVIFETVGCITLAVRNKVARRAPDGVKSAHWLDYAESNYSRKLINDVKAFFKVLVVFLPLPIFWALYDQQGSRWTMQAQQLSGRLGSITIKPDQFQAINPIIVVALVPLFDAFIYPFLAKFNLFKKLLTRMAVGLLFAIAAFLIAAVLESQMQAASAELNKPDQLRFINLSPCNLTLQPVDTDIKLNLPEPSYIRNVAYKTPTKDLFSGENTNKVFVVTGICEKTSITNERIEINNSNLPKNVVIYLENNQIEHAEYWYNINQQLIGSSQLKFTKFGMAETNFTATIYKGNKDIRFDVTQVPTKSVARTGGGGGETDKTYTKVSSDVYSFNVASLNGESELKTRESLDLESCGRYSVLLFNNKNNQIDYFLLQDIYPNGLSLFWQLIQIFVMSIGEIMFSISGVSFAYSQAPTSMKSVITGMWHMTTAFGNLIVVIIAEAKFVDNQVYDYILFAGLLSVATLIFGILGYFYKYVEPAREEDMSAEKLDNGNEFEKSKLEVALEKQPSTKSHLSLLGRAKVGVTNEESNNRNDGEANEESSNRKDVDSNAMMMKSMSASTDEAMDKN